MSNTVEQIKERISINNVLGFYLKGKKDIKGNHKYKCPFHGDGKEKTPSLYASDDRNMFKCFGCGEYGDIISFVRKYANSENELSFFEALEQLKDDFGDELNDVELTYNTNDKEYAYKKLIYEFHDEINEEMIKNLFEKEGKMFLEYLEKDRKLDIDLIKKFKIGYSKGRKIEDLIKKKIKEEKYNSIKLKDTGFFTTNTENKEGIFFLFSDRIMFPIFNNRKKIVGWSGGKTYDKQEPKYINSVNNYVYDKSANLFNLDKINFKDNDTIYICEGNLDSTQLYNYGADNALSLLGTNLTETQINLFKNKIRYVVLLLDADNAGEKAIEKLSGLLLSKGIIPYIMSMGQYKDIDDFLKGNPSLKGNIKEYVNNNKKDILKDYLIEGYIKNVDKIGIEQRYNILVMLRGLYEQINDDIIRNIYKNELSKNNLLFDNLEKEYIENKKEEEKIEKNSDKIMKDKVNDKSKKWDNDKYVLYAIYLINNGYITEEDIEARNIELNMMLNSNELYNKYKNNKIDFENNFKEYIIEFDILKDSKETELFSL